MRRPRTMTETLNPGADVLEAGQHAAFGAAAVVGVLAVGATIYDRLAAPSIEAPPEPGPSYEATEFETLEPALTSDQTVFDDAVLQPATAEAGVAVATPVVFNVPANRMQELLPIAPLAPAVNSGMASQVAFHEETLRLNQPSVFSRPQDEATIETGGRVRAAQSVGERLDAMADQLSYRAPNGQSRDVAVFVAGDDEAVSWALNGSSPNYGAVAYEEGRVDVGNLSAGVALTTDDVRVAAAYVERDMDMRLGRGFENRDQHYAGVILTFKN